MCMDRCDRCGCAIDTDWNPEFYRPDMQCRCLCDACYERVTVVEDEDRGAGGSGQ